MIMVDKKTNSSLEHMHWLRALSVITVIYSGPHVHTYILAHIAVSSSWVSVCRLSWMRQQQQNLRTCLLLHMSLSGNLSGLYLFTCTAETHCVLRTWFVCVSGVTWHYSNFAQICLNMSFIAVQHAHLANKNKTCSFTRSTSCTGFNLELSPLLINVFLVWCAFKGERKNTLRLSLYPF